VTPESIQQAKKLIGPHPSLAVLSKFKSGRAPEIGARIDGFALQFLLNAQQLVVLSQTFASARCTSLDLTSSKTHHQICDE